MATNTPPIAPAVVTNLPLFDIIKDPDLSKLRIALRSWFGSYLSQPDDHVNHSSLSENVWFYEILQEWLDNPTTITAQQTTEADEFPFS